MRNALLYVLHNHAHHDEHRAGLLDVYSSGCYFTGWREPIRLPLVDDGPPPIVPARSWLATRSWMRRRGLISFDETPA